MRVGSVAAGLAAFGTVLVGVPALYLSRRLYTAGLNPANDHAPAALELEVTALGPERVSLRRRSRNTGIRPNEPGQFLLEGARGWGYAGPVLEDNGVVVVREFREGDGELRIGDAVRLDGFAFPDDPMIAHGIGFEDVTCSSQLGDFPAWYIPGTSDTWAILTHGKGADRRESLRVLPTLNRLGLPCLSISYRNDVGCPPAPGGMYSYGCDEWEELEGAAEFAFANGAKQLLLVGYSMGGATTVAFMGRSKHASRVAALVLDAPMLDLETTVRHGAELARLPLWFLAISNRVTALRYRFSWRNFDHRETAQNLQVPVLLFHGDDDRTVPVATSDAFARARPDIVEYYRPTGVDHVRAWNADPDGYSEAVRQFVTAHILEAARR